MSADAGTLAAHAEQCLFQGRADDAERIFRELAGAHPGRRDFEECLVLAMHLAGKRTEALARMRAMLEGGTPTGDAAYDAVYFEALAMTGSTPVPLRRMLRFHALVTALRSVLDLEGDVAECGCFRGLSSYLLCSTLRSADAGFTGAGYAIFDSFRGLTAPAVEDEIPPGMAHEGQMRIMSQRGAFAASQEEVRRNLAAFPDIAYHPGLIPLSFRRLAPRNYRFVHVDVDLYDPTLDCLMYFYPQLVPGGILLCDDFGWPGARKAIEEYCADAGIGFEVTPHQQAVIRR